MFSVTARTLGRRTTTQMHCTVCVSGVQDSSSNSSRAAVDICQSLYLCIKNDSFRLLVGCTAQSSIAVVLLYSIYVHSTVANRQSWLLGHRNSVHLLGAPRSGVERASHFLCGLWLCRCRRRRWHRPHARREASRAEPPPAGAGISDLDLSARQRQSCASARARSCAPGTACGDVDPHGPCTSLLACLPQPAWMPGAQEESSSPLAVAAACVRSIGLAFTVRSTSQQQSGQMAAKLLWQ